MHDLYQIPALILTILLLPAFGQLYLRTRDIRNLLWFLAFTLVAIRSALVYSTGNWAFLGQDNPWNAAAGESFGLVAAALFLGSLSPLGFKLGRVRILYAVPFTAPLVLYALLAYGIYRGVTPHGPMLWLFPFLGFCSILVGLVWGRAKGSLPTWLGLSICIVFGALAVSFYFRDGLFWPLILAECGTYLVTALLVFTVFRRISVGVVLSMVGFAMWSLPLLLLSPRSRDVLLHLLLIRLVVMAKVATALGLILLALENELALNKAATDREQQGRRELQAYAGLELSRRRLEDFDRQADHICATVAEHSRFSHVALLLLHNTGMYRLAGAAGFDSATAQALDAIAARIPVPEFLQPSASAPPAGSSQAVQIDLRPWMRPGDDLERLQFHSILAVPMQGRAAVEGAMLLSGQRSNETLRHDDLAPIEMLTARMQSVRSQTRMLEKLIDSERFAGLGQLAGNVTQQLHNPLTVILGYASLLDETPGLEVQERKGIDAILTAARTMRSTLESLHRVARTPNSKLVAASLPELLADMEQLNRPEFLQRSIQMHVIVPPELPRILCQPQQLRQAILHCLQYAMEALESVPAQRDRIVTLEAAAAGPHARITISHSGPGFAHPDRAFDPFVPARAAAGETIGLGLTLCATIMRENNGQATAKNLDPSGAAIVLELEAA